MSYYEIVTEEIWSISRIVQAKTKAEAKEKVVNGKYLVLPGSDYYEYKVINKLTKNDWVINKIDKCDLPGH